MIRKSKSVITVIILALICVVAFGLGAWFLRAPQKTEFSGDGYFLKAAEKNDVENGTASEQIWFAKGESFKTEQEQVSFTDTEGTKEIVPNDSFIYYQDGDLAAVKPASVMDLDDFSSGMIQYYTMDTGTTLSGAGGQYTLGDGENQVSFTNYMVKSSDSRYLFGSAEIVLIMADSSSSAVIDSGHAEVEYLEDDHSVARIQDGTNIWQFLTAGARLDLSNDVSLDLATGELMTSSPASADGSDQAGTSAGRYYIGDISTDLSVGVGLDVKTGESFSYPTYRFTVVNGEDGQDGEDGQAGESGSTGTDGSAGERGSDGSSDTSVNNGQQGATGRQGNTAMSGFSGGQVSGLEVTEQVPVVTLKDWVVSGRALKFTLYMDEDSSASVTEGTTRISLVDVETGEEVYYWDTEGDKGGTGQSIDFSVDSEEGYSLYCNALQAGHQYRFTVYAGYTVNEVSGTQAILSRTFTADDYGISFDLLERNSGVAKFALRQSNKNVTVAENEDIQVFVNGEYVGTMLPADYENYVLELGKNRSNQTYEVTFKVPVSISSYDEENDEMVKTALPDLIEYSYQITTLKELPEVGGVRLTAYDSGYFMAEALGVADAGAADGTGYKALKDEDDAIEEIIFELYDYPFYLDSFKELSSEQQSSHKIAEQVVKSGSIAYFKAENPTDNPDAVVKTGVRYYLKARYTYSDGEKEITVPILETAVGRKSPNYQPDETVDGSVLEVTHADKKEAWDTALLNSVSKTVLSFTGDQNTYNTVEDHKIQRDPGITFNAIQGMVEAKMNNANNLYYVSTQHPVELQISAEPDYYKSIFFTSVSNGRLGKENTASPVSLAGSTITMPLELDGLKADTSYMITMYAYEASSVGVGGEPEGLSRMILGSMSIHTAASKELKVTLNQEAAMDLGCTIVLGEPSATNYYNRTTKTYNEDAYWVNTDNVYRTIASMTFELYREGSADPIGTCTISNTSSRDEARYSSLYEDFYGVNAAATLHEYQTSARKYKGIVGIGSSEYVYAFKDSSGNEIQPSMLTNGKYRIDVKCAYDYTDTRYDVYMNAHTDDERLPYSYYTYRAERKGYINTLVVNGGVTATTGWFKYSAMPYLVPGEDIQYPDGSYIKVETLKNSELGAYNADKDQNDLYCDLWEADTVAGLKLTTKYKNDDQFTTDTFDFYGFDYDAWKTAKSDGSKLIRKDLRNYGFHATIEMAANNCLEVPEIWLLFYDSDSLPAIETAGFMSSRNNGYNYSTTVQVNGKTVYIYYMDKKFFSRGHSYVFAYDAELPTYTYKNMYGLDDTGFTYPDTYYTQISKTPYVLANTLKSNVVSVPRQTPKVYSVLKRTNQRDTTADTGYDDWKVYADDPDGALIWKTILGAADSTVQEGIDNLGGIYDLFGAPLPPVKSVTGSDGVIVDTYLTLRFLESENAAIGSGVAVTTHSTYGTKDEVVYGKVADEQLDKIARYMENVERDDNGAIYDRGGYIRVQNLKDTGVAYKAAVRYSIQDDENAAQGAVNLIQHSYIGYHDYSTGNSRLSTVIDNTAADRNTMYIRLGASVEDQSLMTNPMDIKDAYYKSQTYLNKARGIAAIELQTFNVSKHKWIEARNEYGNKTGQKKSIWLAPEMPSDTADDYRYYARFKLSDLDQSDTTDLQYEAGDTLKFRITVYYATGSSGNEGVNYSTDGGTRFVVKYLNKYTQEHLAGASDNTYAYSFLVPSGSIVSQGTGAGRSLFDAKSTYDTSGTLPWTQKINVKSTTFETTGFADKAVANDVELTDSSGYQNNVVLEVLKTAQYTIAESDETAVQVQSALPALESASAVGGITRVQLKGKVGNWNLVKYPEDEDLHLYYLIYEYGLNGNDAVKVALKGAMIGEPEGSGILDNKGNLNVTFQLDKKGQYWIEVYYKSEEAGADSTYFNGNLQTGKLLTGDDAREVEAEIRNESTLFPNISGIPNDRILVSTGEGITISSVSLELGNTAEYRNKQLTAAANISTEILRDEQDSMAVFYRLERCEEAKYNAETGEGTGWETVIADNRETGVSNWADDVNNNDKKGPAYWQYYQKDLTISPEAAFTGRNRMDMKYYAGGVIRPGYAYRVSARVFQKIGDSWQSISKADENNQEFVYSSAKVWNSIDFDLDPNMMIQVSNVSRGSKTLNASYRVRDLNNTSLDGKYFVRLAELQGDGTWKILDDSSYSTSYKQEGGSSWQNKAFQMGASYSASFSNLNPETTYRLFFYALVDPEFNNQINVVESGDRLKLPGKDLADNTLNVMDLGYYTKPNQTKIKDRYTALYQKFFGISSPSSTSGLKVTKDVSHEAVIGYTDTYMTRSQDAVASVGDQYGTIVGNNELTLKFTGAFGLDNISRIEYRLYHAQDTTIDCSAVVDKPDSVKSLFDRTGVPGDGTDGDVTLTLNPEQEMNKSGVYHIVIRFETRTENGSYTTVESHTYMFNKKD